MNISAQRLIHIYGKNHDELTYLADKHTRIVQAWLASRSPMGEQTQRNGIGIASTGLRVPHLNLALGSNFQHNINDKAVDRIIKTVAGYFKKRNVPWHWWIAPNSLPVDIDLHLKRNRIGTEPRKLPVMIAPTISNLTRPVGKAGIVVWRAKGIPDLRAASRIRHQAFQFPKNEALHYFEEMAGDWLSDYSPARLFLAGYNVDDPVSIGATILGGGLPGIYVMATSPNYMRRGFGKAIFSHILQHIHREHGGKKMIILTASRYGYPLYAQFGFRHLFDYSIY